MTNCNSSLKYDKQEIKDIDKRVKELIKERKWWKNVKTVKYFEDWWFYFNFVLPLH